MNKDSKLNIHTDSNSATGKARISGSLTGARSRYLAGPLKQLKRWMKASLNSHEKRTASLRVYRQNRTD